jgi:hypothetical protein
MAKAISNLAILYVSTMMPEAVEAKFTIETKVPNHNVQYGKPVQMHLDRIQLTPSIKSSKKP